MSHDVFISYSGKDKQTADALCHVLEQNKVSCWIAPRDVTPGKPYALEIIEGIKNCKIVVIVFSKNSNISEHVKNELQNAFAKNKIIVPFIVDETPMDEEFDYYLARKHWIVAYPHPEVKFKDLLEVVINLIGKSSTTTGNSEKAELEKKAKYYEDICNKAMALRKYKELFDMDKSNMELRHKIIQLQYEVDNARKKDNSKYMIWIIVGTIFLIIIACILGMLE